MLNSSPTRPMRGKGKGELLPPVDALAAAFAGVCHGHVQYTSMVVNHAPFLHACVPYTFFCVPRHVSSTLSSKKISSTIVQPIKLRWGCPLYMGRGPESTPESQSVFFFWRQYSSRPIAAIYVTYE
uniref:Uncharacterized protein n=1 Tax=Eutreptiella gymnastica TaxID=73025 RepID=A0A7S1NCY3_9EUGL